MNVQALISVLLFSQIFIIAQANSEQNEVLRLPEEGSYSEGLEKL